MKCQTSMISPSSISFPQLGCLPHHKISEKAFRIFLMQRPLGLGREHENKQFTSLANGLQSLPQINSSQSYQWDNGKY